MFLILLKTALENLPHLHVDDRSAQERFQAQRKKPCTVPFSKKRR